MYNEVTGNLIKLAEAGEFDVIAHGCNCFCQMGAGIAPQMAKAFGVDDFKLEGDEYKRDFNKLGNIDYEHVGYHPKGAKVGRRLTAVNTYTQFGFGRNHDNGTEQPLNYYALGMCLTKINHEFKGQHIGLPMIGCGLAGGDWDVVKEMIKDLLVDCNVTVVMYDGI